MNNGNGITGPKSPVKLFRKLYQDGNSTRQIAKITGFSYGWIHKVVRDISRPRSEAIRMGLPPLKDTEHWRTCRNRARTAMERHLGRKLDRLEYVHHIDEDYTNNSIENLEILSPREHSRRHNPDWETPVHKRPRKIAYMKNYNRKTLPTICAGCGKEFMADRYEKPKTCSRQCASSLRKKHAV